MNTETQTPNSLILLGHNGAGKSTLIRWLLGFYTHASQHPFLAHWQKVPQLNRQGLGFVPELPYLDQHLTAHDQFRLFAKLKSEKLSQQEMIMLLNRTGLSQDVLDQSIKQYSKGMKQRLMIALALIGNPHTLLLDEPLSGLDPFGHQQIVALLQEVKKHCRLIFSTHNLDDAWKLGDEIWLLQGGRFVYQGEKPGSQNDLNALYFDHPPLHTAA